MAWESIMAQVAPVLVTLVLLLVGWAVGEGIRYLRERVKDTIFARAFAVLETTIDAIVKDLQNTLAEDFKNAAADGKLTREELNIIKDKAVALVMAQIPATLQKILEAYLGPLAQYVASRIEARMYELKQFEVVAPKSLACLSSSARAL